jgi:hypothetical protein
MNDVCLQITLRGRVSVAGWRYQRKGVGCAPCGRQQVILPRANRKGVEHDVSKEVYVGTRFVIAKAVREVLDAAFGLASCCDLRMRSRLSRAGFRRTGESKRRNGMEIMDVIVCVFLCLLSSAPAVHLSLKASNWVYCVSITSLDYYIYLSIGGDRKAFY